MSHIETDESIGNDVWIPDDDLAWIKGTVTATNKEKKTCTVQISNGDFRTLTLDNMRVCNTFETSDGLLTVKDLTNLTHLHEPSLLEALTKRFGSNKIYTNTGPILLAVNPFQRIDGLYSKDLLLNYYTTGMVQSQLNSSDGSMDLPPHIYKTADSAYRALLDEDEIGGNFEEEKNDDFENSFSVQNQSILVSGESGAGKTESTKHIMNYLATVSNQNAKNTSKQRISEMVLKSNPILESFGNARTIRNDNSSRFGKFIEMQFDYKGQLVGAKIRTYLLEKVRINQQTKGERNYHVFYQLFKGATKQMKEELKLNELELSLETCSLTNMSKCYKRKDGVSDSKMFDEMLQAMRTMSFKEEEISSILSIISALMHFSSVSFEHKNVDGNEGSKLKEENKNKERIEIVSEMFKLKVTFEDFEKSLTERKRVVNTEVFHNVLNESDAKAAKEAVIKTIYSRLFNWIVKRVNNSIEFNPSLDASFDSTMDLNFIGVLDIFGFEVFENNSFEQLCINYANETLQQQFNHYIFKLEQKEYEKEQICWNQISFPDNESVLRLIDGKPIGVLSLLDEQCLFPNGNDEKLARKLYEKLENRAEFTVTVKQKVNFLFCIHHYAGKVCYDSKSFVEKNKDQLFQEALDLLQTSECDFICQLFPKGEKTGLAKETKSATKGRSIQAVTVGTQFKSQLQSLLEVIKQTRPHYVRCLKPNDENIKIKLNRKRLLDQLRYGGVLEAVKVARAGYPVRMPIEEFKARYKPLCKEDEVEEMCENSFKLKKIDDFQIGLTKVFLRKKAYQIVEAKRMIYRRKAAVIIQSWVRMYLSKQMLKQLKKNVILIQQFVRVVFAKQKVHKLRQRLNSTKIQTIFRKYLARSIFLQKRKVVTKIQSLRRGVVGRRRALELKTSRSIFILQKFARMGVDRRRFLSTRKLVIRLQRQWRLQAAKKTLRKLKREAREVGNLQKKLEDLKQRNKELEEEVDNEKEKNESLEKIIEEKDMDDELLVVKEQLYEQRKENSKLVRQNEDLRKEISSIKTSSTTSEEIETTQEEINEAEEGSETEMHSSSDEILNDVTYWSNKMTDDGEKVKVQERSKETMHTSTPLVVDAELQLKLETLEEENIKLKEQLEAQKVVVEVEAPKNKSEVVSVKQELNEVKVALNALAQENKDFKRAHHELQQNMSDQIERVCQAENRAIELEEETNQVNIKLEEVVVDKEELSAQLEDTLKKVDAMSILSEQTSAVKIALAKRLEELLAEKKKLKNSCLSLRKKANFFSDTNKELQREIERNKKFISNINK